MNASATIKAPFDRDKQFAAKRRAVILSAASAFRRRGYHNTSMVDIAKTLGLTKAALYYYVRNKEEILFESHLMAYESMEAILKRPQIGEDGLECLENVFREFVSLLTQSGVSLLTDVDSLSGKGREQILARRGKIERRVIKLVKAGQKDGSIQRGDARLQVFFFMGALNWLNAWYDSEGRLKGDDIADHFVKQLRSGIAADIGEIDE